MFTKEVFFRYLWCTSIETVTALALVLRLNVILSEKIFIRKHSVSYAIIFFFRYSYHHMVCLHSLYQELVANMVAMPTMTH